MSRCEETDGDGLQCRRLQGHEHRGTDHLFVTPDETKITLAEAAKIGKLASSKPVLMCDCKRPGDEPHRFDPWKCPMVAVPVSSGGQLVASNLTDDQLINRPAKAGTDVEPAAERDIRDPYRRRYRFSMPAVIEIEVDVTVPPGNQDVVEVVIDGLMTTMKHAPTTWRKQYGAMFPEIIGATPTGKAYGVTDVGPGIGQ